MESEYMKELEQLVEFLKNISVANDDDRNILSEAREKVNDVHRNLPGKISSNSDIAYFIFQDSKSAVIKELNDVCDKLSDLSIKADIQNYVASLPQHDDDCSSFDDDVDVDEDDDDDDDSDYDDGHVAEKSIHLQRKNILAQEIEYYDQILKFMGKLVPGSEFDPDHIILSKASWLIRLEHNDLFISNNAVESSSVWAGKHLTSMITDSRLKLETYLNATHNNVTNLTIKEDLGRFIAELRPQTLPFEILDSSLDYTDGNEMSSQSEMTTIELKPESCSGEDESGSGGWKSPINLPENHEAKDEHDDYVGYYHDHDKCIEEEEERYFPRFIRIGNWDPEYEGHGISLLDPSALRDHSEDESDYVNMCVVGSTNLLSEMEADLANVREGSPKFPLESEPDLANMSEGSPKFPPPG